jgi:hypothetical protein
MRKEYDFSGGKRGAVIASPGSGYQRLINAELRQALARALDVSG